MAALILSIGLVFGGILRTVFFPDRRLTSCASPGNE